MAYPKRNSRKGTQGIAPDSTIPSENLEIKPPQQTKDRKDAPNPRGEEGKPKEENVISSWTRKEVINTIIQAIIALAAAASVIVVYSLMSGQNEEYRQTAHTELRAYVVPLTPIRRVFYGKEVISIPIVNLGKTPALHFSANIVYECSDSMTWKPNGLYWIAPDKRLRWLAPSTPDTEVIQPQVWKKDGQRLYVYGTIWYDDIMGYHDSTVFAFQYESFRGGTFVKLPDYDYIK